MGVLKTLRGGSNLAKLGWESAPSLGFAGGLQRSRISKPRRYKYVQMQTNKKVHLNWKTVLMVFNLFDFYTTPQTQSNSLRLLFCKFTACIFPESEILKKVNSLCAFGWWSSTWCPCLLQLWEGCLVSMHIPLPPFLLLQMPKVLHACHCCDNGWSHYRICHLFTQVQGLKPQIPLCRTRYWVEDNCLSGITNSG